MHANAKIVEQLYTALNRHTADVMATCYHPNASFRDIAFDLSGREQVGAMWAMLCSSDIQVTFEITHTDKDTAIARLVDEYTFSETGRKVHNTIESRFRFCDGLIIEHVDSCDRRLWAAMAIGGIQGFLAGRVGLLRRWKAAQLLRKYRAAHQVSGAESRSQTV